MNTWIFQGNPRVFDIDNYVKNHKYIWWSLRQEYYFEKVQIGDVVFLWRSDGGQRGTGGIPSKGKSGRLTSRKNR
jgi:5-methylcytosine-specific restriction enzyme A